ESKGVQPTKICAAQHRSGSRGSNHSARPDRGGYTAERSHPANLSWKASTMTMITWHRFVLHHQALDFLRLGWCDRAPLSTERCTVSVLVSWLCSCPLVEPAQN